MLSDNTYQLIICAPMVQSGQRRFTFDEEASGSNPDRSITWRFGVIQTLRSCPSGIAYFLTGRGVGVNPAVAYY